MELKTPSKVRVGVGLRKDKRVLQRGVESRKTKGGVGRDVQTGGNGPREVGSSERRMIREKVCDRRHRSRWVVFHFFQPLIDYSGVLHLSVNFIGTVLVRGGETTFDLRSLRTGTVLDSVLDLLTPLFLATNRLIVHS